MSTQIAQVKVNNFTGTYNIPPQAVAQGVTAIDVALDGTNMTNPALLVEWTFDYSPDGGTTWASTSPSASMDPFPTTGQFQGGATTKAGAPLPTYTMTTDMPIGSETLTTRQIKGTAVVSGAKLTTTITISTEP